MLCLGFNGGLNLVHENPYEMPSAFTHDGAAVIIRDGEVLAGVEEERLNRVKHSNKFPVSAIRFCLDQAGAKLSDVDKIAFYASEEYSNALLTQLYLKQPTMVKRLMARDVIVEMLQREFDTSFDPDRLLFVRHHVAHAMSAYALSGFKRSLVLAIDGYGDFLSGLVGTADAEGLVERETYSQDQSLGTFYLETIRFLGYGPFDEYKVMGLAPYGNASRFRKLFRGLYDLLPDGKYEVHNNRIAEVLLSVAEPRKSGQLFNDTHQDIAAALQEALETIVLHILHHHSAATGERHLCLAGGVAHNCSMNGRILSSGLFDEVFVQPAAHDAGCALGAALIAAGRTNGAGSRLRNVYWGPDIGSAQGAAEELALWSDFIHVEKCDNIARRTAELLAAGAVVGWAQGRSEFGPRALGNRSILADPRPADNKTRINAMVKKREGYRPFAPSVLQEDARDFFVIPEGATELPFMIFVVKVQEDKRSILGATTHVDGTARIHTVARDINLRYWQLINAFKELTGVPVVLNTSFNNNAEPIVDSVNDAIVTYLTTKLDYLVIDDYLVAKRTPSQEQRQSLNVSLPAHIWLQQSGKANPGRGFSIECEMRSTANPGLRRRISQELFTALLSLQAPQSISNLLAVPGLADTQPDGFIEEIETLWEERLLILAPDAAAAAPKKSEGHSSNIAMAG
ncbi:nodulation protein [Agrobacterium rhizogenes]|nr:nodulation protein [Rhizobium rhizogenes]NTG12115.1 nodulation protein [Rhizobium rhizogenes]